MTKIKNNEWKEFLEVQKIQMIDFKPYSPHVSMGPNFKIFVFHGVLFLCEISGARLSGYDIASTDGDWDLQEDKEEITRLCPKALVVGNFSLTHTIQDRIAKKMSISPQIIMEQAHFEKLSRDTEKGAIYLKFLELLQRQQEIKRITSIDF